MNTKKTAVLELVASMAIFSTIGLLRKALPTPSGFLCFARGLLGSAFLLLFFPLVRKKPDLGAVRKKLPLLLLSGVCLGGNWVFLFESYRLTASIAVSTVCYYMAPILATVLSCFVFRDRLTGKGIACIGAAAVGLVLVSGLCEEGFETGLPAILTGLAAACFYSFILLINKKLTEVPNVERTVIQLFTAAIAVGIYAFLSEDPAEIAFDGKAIVYTLILGLLHTGVAFLFFFDAVPKLPTGTSAILCYVDPVGALLLSALFLQEPLSPLGIVGAVLVLGSALVNELSFGKKKAE